MRKSKEAPRDVHMLFVCPCSALFVVFAAGLGPDCVEELQMEMKTMKMDFEEKLLDEGGGKKMQDVEKQTTAQKQELAGKVSYRSGGRRFYLLG